MCVHGNLAGLDKVGVSRRLRSGFTLVELLAVIAIMGILTVMAMVAIRGAQRDVYTARTRSTLNKIQQALAARWEQYLAMPMPLRLPGAAFERNDQGIRALSPNETARVRLLAVRNLMAIELPDRPGDIKYSDVTGTKRSLVLVPRQLGARTYETRTGSPVRSNGIALPGLCRLEPSSHFISIRSRIETATKNWDDQFANEELLYLVVESTMLGTSAALESFRPWEIGDVDRDGLHEFLDAWGHPIAWIRWPAGAINQVADDRINDLYATRPLDRFGFGMEGDPLDPIQSDMGLDPEFRALNASTDDSLAPGPGMFPLIVSAGPDGRFGIRREWDGVSIDFSACDVTWPLPGMVMPQGYPSPYSYPDPYHPRHEGIEKKLGYIQDYDQAADNVSNYDSNGVGS